MADEEFMFGDLFATVRVQGLPASREVVAVERQENGAWRVCGSAIANADGIAELGIEGSKTSRVYAFAIDHWGEPFTPNRTVAYGDIIRPSVFLGWLYRVTAPGVLPGEEPVWWNSTPGMPRPVGSAMAQAEMYFQPIAHGPVDIEWEDKEEGDPHWDNVVALLHFDGQNGSSGVVDEKGLVFWAVNNAILSSASPMFGQTSLVLDGKGSYISAPAKLPLTGAFTAECWIKTDNTKAQSAIFSQYHQTNPNISGRLSLTLDQGRLTLFTGGNGSTGEVFSDLIYPFGYYAHISLCRDELNNWYVSMQGEVRQIATSGIALSNEQFVIGRTSSNHSHRDFDGHIDELRITKGVARYTENFTPPTEPFPNFK